MFFRFATTNRWGSVLPVGKRGSGGSASAPATPPTATAPAPENERYFENGIKLGMRWDLGL